MGHEWATHDRVLARTEQGVRLWHLATVMGTSVTQLEDTYARWLKRTDDLLRDAFDTYGAVATRALTLDDLVAAMLEQNDLAAFVHERQPI
jgi:hypothetical protein